MCKVGEALASPQAGKVAPTLTFFKFLTSETLGTFNFSHFRHLLLRNLDPIRESFNIPIGFDFAVEYVFATLPVLQAGIGDG